MFEIEDIVPDKDERIHMRDRGASRDLGRNPAFDGTKQRGVNLPEEMSVGGFGERNQRVRSMAATAVSFSGASGVVYEGAGAFRGFCIHPGVTGDDTVSIEFRAGNANGNLIAACYAAPAQTVIQYLGDFGVNFDTLYVKVTVVTAGSNPRNGIVYVASVE